MKRLSGRKIEKLTDGKLRSPFGKTSFTQMEKENPFEKLLGKNGEYKNHMDRERASLWFYESKFAEMMQTVDDRRILNEYLAEYRAYRGKSLPNIHELLRVLLFNRYFHWSSESPSEPAAMDDFYRFVQKFYS